MMRIWVGLVAVALCVGLFRMACSEEPTNIGPGIYPLRELTCPTPLLRSCCDNYCSKPLPGINCPCCICGPDDYCCKPLPFIPCFRGCCPDCYGSKPCPDLCRPIAADYYSCDGWSAGCAAPFFPGSVESAVPSEVSDSMLDGTEVFPPSSTLGRPH